MRRTIGPGAKKGASMSLRRRGKRTAQIVTAGLIAGSSALTALGSAALWDSTGDGTAEAPRTSEGTSVSNSSSSDSVTSPLSTSDGGAPHARSTGS